MPIEIVWSPLARARLCEIRAYIAQDNPETAERLAMRLVSVVETLKVYPYLGRAGAAPGIRELVIGGTPYIVVYRVRGKRITVLTIWHGAQRKER
ncbi:MAG: type II toxin-antitoxin system RelE/ParE family toxin [Terriglobia bacterium]